MSSAYGIGYGCTSCDLQQQRLHCSTPVAFDSHIITNMSPASCNKCGSTRSSLGEALLSCARCKTTFYCGKECQKKDWSKHRLQCKKIVPFPMGSTVVDARRMARDHPDTFDAPEDRELAAIKPGAAVKICLEDAPGTLMGSLRFWNKVLYVHKSGSDPSEWTFIALTKNNSPIPGLPVDSRVMFKGKNIYQTMTTEQIHAQPPLPAVPFEFSTARNNRR